MTPDRTTARNTELRLRSHAALLRHLTTPPTGPAYRLWLGPGLASEPLTLEQLVAAAKERR